MKKAIFLVLTVVFGFALASVAFAHSGGTDSRGGHTNRSTGEYHYHHGYSAHQHEDLDGDGELDCPFDFVDKTEQSSGSTYRNYPVYTYDPVPIPTEKPKKEFDPSNNLLFIVGIMLLGIGFVFLPVLIHELKKRRKPAVKHYSGKKYVPGAQKALDAYLDEKNRK